MSTRRRLPWVGARTTTLTNQRTALHVDSELTCPVLAAHQMPAASAFVPLWACGRSAASAKPSSTCPQARRRADLSGAFGVIVGLFERSLIVVAADAARSVEEGVRAVRIEVDLDPRLDEMRPHRTWRDLQLQRPVGDAIVLSDLALLLHA